MAVEKIHIQRFPISKKSNTYFLLLRLILRVIFLDRRIVCELEHTQLDPGKKSKTSFIVHNDEIPLPDHLLTQGIESLTIRFLTASGSGFAYEGGLEAASLGPKSL